MFGQTPGFIPKVVSCVKAIPAVKEKTQVPLSFSTVHNDFLFSIAIHEPLDSIWCEIFPIGPGTIGPIF